MSNYIRKTKNPITGQFERAEWLDDYFGKHRYGVRFASEDNHVWIADSQDWEFDDPQPNPSLPCPNCEGSGKRRGGHPNQTEYTCPICHGTGVVEATSSKPDRPFRFDAMHIGPCIEQGDSGKCICMSWTGTANPVCPTCGKPTARPYNDLGECITCGRDRILGTGQLPPDTCPCGIRQCFCGGTADPGNTEPDICTFCNETYGTNPECTVCGRPEVCPNCGGNKRDPVIGKCPNPFHGIAPTTEQITLTPDMLEGDWSLKVDPDKIACRCDPPHYSKAQHDADTTAEQKPTKNVTTTPVTDKKEDKLDERQLLHKWFGGQTAQLIADIGRDKLLEIARICERRRP